MKSSHIIRSYAIMPCMPLNKLKRRRKSGSNPSPPQWVEGVATFPTAGGDRVSQPYYWGCNGDGPTTAPIAGVGPNESPPFFGVLPHPLRGWRWGWLQGGATSFAFFSPFLFCFCFLYFLLFGHV